MSLGRRARWTGGTPPAVLVAAIAVFATTLLVANAVSPLRAAAPVAYDTSAIVLQFDRIVSGRIIEQPIPTTPKPLLSVIYGPIWEVTHDWRPIEWTAVIALACSAALATILAARFAGLGAGLLAGVAFATSTMLMWEALRALGTPWAVLGWMVAGLALTAVRPRYLVAGVALMLASLARTETLIPLVVAFGALAVLRFGPSNLRRPVPPASWLVLVGLFALPLMMVHDWLLIRDPLYWAHVSGAYAAAHPATAGLHGMIRVTKVLLVVLGPMIGLVALAVLGSVLLWRQRRWVLLLGVVSLAVGDVALLLWFGYLGYTVPERYVAPVVVAVYLAAAIGYGGLRVGPLRGDAWPRSTAPGAAGEDPPDLATAGDRSFPLLSVGVSRWWRTGIVAVAAVVAAIGLAGPVAPRDRSLQAEARRSRELHDGANLALSSLRAAVAQARTDPTVGGLSELVVVPGQLRPRMALELGLPLTAVAAISDYGKVDLATGPPVPGQIMLYEQAADPTKLAGELAVASPTIVSGLVVDPVFADPTNGTWVVRIRRP